MCGVDVQSQAAYEFAVKGLLRPANSEIPIIYGLKCVEFDSPNFTLGIYYFIEVYTFFYHITYIFCYRSAMHKWIRDVS